MTGAAAELMVKENTVGPAVPTPFIALTLMLETAAVVADPLKSPVDDRVRPAGTPVADQVIGAVPEAVN
jgi:hypothetical protein